MSDSEPRVETAATIFDEPDPSEYNAFIDSMKLIAIETVSLSGERLRSEAIEGASFELKAGFQVDADQQRVTYLFSGEAAIGESPQTQPSGRVKCSVGVTISTPLTENHDVIAHFGNTSGVRMAHPYMREVIAATSLRLGFPGVLLPAMVFQADGLPATAADTEAIARSAALSQPVDP